MSRHNLPTDNAILQELQILEVLLSDAGAPAGQSALVRLLPDHPSTDWPTVLRQHNLYSWMVCTLGEQRFPALTQLLGHIEELEDQKDRDPLTGLRNRRALDRALRLEVERATRFQTPLSFAMIDLDDFKRVNDTHGHPCGDKVLQKMAEILHAETRKIDIVARYGGEEFAVLLPGTGLMRAQKLLERIVHNVRAASVQCASKTITCTCSIGVASYRGKAAPNMDTLIREADKALYRAKQNGKNRLECAPLLDLGPHLDDTLVQQNEKKFLFSSGA